MTRKELPVSSFHLCYVNKCYELAYLSGILPIPPENNFYILLWVPYVKNDSKSSDSELTTSGNSRIWLVLLYCSLTWKGSHLPRGLVAHSQSIQKNEGFTGVFSPPTPLLLLSVHSQLCANGPTCLLSSLCSVRAKDVISYFTMGVQWTVKSKTKVAHW